MTGPAQILVRRLARFGVAAALVAVSPLPALATDGPPVVDPLLGVPGYHALYAVSSLDPGNSLVVGVGGARFVARARNWDGVRWAPTYPPFRARSALRGTVMLGPSEGWAVGDRSARALALHWDGTGWARVPAGGGRASRTLTAVDAAAPDDVWAVGRWSPPGLGYSTPLFEHWDGHAWATYWYAGPRIAGTLNSVTVVSPTDAWAVGSTDAYESLIMHWDGDRWRRVPKHGRPLEYRALYAVDAVGPDDVWAVGAVQPESGCTRRPMALHWDGSRWDRVHLPIPRCAHDLDSLFGVAAVSTGDVWAVGGMNGTGRARNRILHWDGTRWHRVRSPNPGTTRNVLYAVAATGVDDAWAVGALSNDDDATQVHLYLHWDGQRWARVRPGG
jgi:hypothetical protein